MALPQVRAARFSTVLFLTLVATFGMLLFPGRTTSTARPAAASSVHVVGESIEAAPRSATSAPRAASLAARADTRRACGDRAYSVEQWRVTGTYRWFYNAGGAPRPVGSQALSAIKAATTTAARGSNDCGIHRNPIAKQAYAGATARRAQLNTDGGCTGNDGYSVASWMRMRTSALAVTCTYYDDAGRVLASDVALNSTYSWFTKTPRGCDYAFDVQSVLTHERGHTFGLGHVDPRRHGGQTMTTTIPACNTTKRTLGAGDLSGLAKLYGTR